MANYFSISDGEITDSGVFGRTIDSADAVDGVSVRPVGLTPINVLPFYATASTSIYGVAVNIFSRATSPSGTIDIELIGPSGSVFAESFDISLVTPYSDVNNLITVNPQNWQIFKLSSPTTLTQSGSYTLQIKATNAGEIDLTGDDIGIDVVNDAKLDVTGTYSTNTPFPNSIEESVRGSLVATFNPPAFGLDTDDFTVEGYFYFHSFNGTWMPLINFGDGAGRDAAGIISSAAWGMSYNVPESEIYFWRSAKKSATTQPVFSFFSGKTSTPLPTNKWIHIAVARKASRASIWVDGVCIFAYNTNSTFYSAIKKQKLKIGTFIKDGVSFSSNMSVSNVRITKGISLYDPDILPPTPAPLAGLNFTITPLSLRTGTTFLYTDRTSDQYLAEANNTLVSLPLDSNNVIVDSNNVKFSKTGAAALDLSSDTPFAGASENSINFNGSFVCTSDSSNGNFTTGDFTFEAWIKPKKLDGTRIIAVYSQAASTSNSYYIFGVQIVDGYLQCYIVTKTFTKIIITSTSLLTVDVWSHIAFVRDNTNIRMFIEGVLAGTAAIPNAINKIVSPDLPYLTLGGDKNNTKNYEGGISSARFSNVVLYTTDFDSAQVPNGANIQAPEPLSTFESEVTRTDEITVQPVVYNVGDLYEKYSCTSTLELVEDNPFLLSLNESIKFTRLDRDSNIQVGSTVGDFITLPLTRNSIYNIGDTDFTLEAWIKLASLPRTDAGVGRYINLSYFTIASVGSSSSDGYKFTITHDKIRASGYQSANISEYNHNFTINTWYHVAFVRRANYMTVYINGVATGPATLFNSTGDSYNLNELTSVVNIGRAQPASELSWGAFFDGLITNFRFIRGTALYTSNFDTSQVAGGVDISSPEPVDIYNNTNGTGWLETNGIVYTSDEVPHTGVNFSYHFTGNAGITIPCPNANIGYADFTVECWVKPTEEQYSGTILEIPLTYGAGEFSVSVGDREGDTNSLTFRTPTNASLEPLGSYSSNLYTIPINQWSHIAIVKDNSNDSISWYLNGTLLGTAQIKALRPYLNIPIVAKEPVVILGAKYKNSNKNYMFKGYIADLRVTAGVAVYPTASFPTTSSTDSLSDVPARAVALPMTSTNTVAAREQFAPFSGAHSYRLHQSQSGRSREYISTNTIGKLESKFTIEAWIYVPGDSIVLTQGSALQGSYYYVQDIFNTIGVWRFSIIRAKNKSNYYLQFTKGPSKATGAKNDTIISDSALSTNAWVHIAICRDEDDISMYINGARTTYSAVYTPNELDVPYHSLTLGSTLPEAIANLTNTSTYNTASYLIVGGGYSTQDSPHNYIYNVNLDGYIFDARVSASTARYSGDIIAVPTEPFVIDQDTTYLQDGTYKFSPEDSLFLQHVQNNRPYLAPKIQLTSTKALYDISNAGGSSAYHPTISTDEDSCIIEFWMHPFARSNEQRWLYVFGGNVDCCNGRPDYTDLTYRQAENYYISKHNNNSPEFIMFALNPGTVYSYNTIANNTDRIQKLGITDTRNTTSGSFYQAITTEACIKFGKWNYIALVITNTTAKLYVNGQLQTTYQRSVKFVNVGEVIINGNGTPDYLASTFDPRSNAAARYPYGVAAGGLGYITNVRVRTGAFINEVPTEPFSVTPKTLFLLQSPFTDYFRSVPEAKATNTTPTPFVGLYNESIFVDRSNNSFIRRRHIDDSLRQKTEFTVEGWFYLLEKTVNGQAYTVWRNGNSGNYYKLIIKDMQIYVYVNEVAIPVIASGITLQSNQWNYFALSQDSSSTLRLFIDAGNTGTALYSGSHDSSHTVASTIYNQDTYIGEGIFGYISNFRESKRALYLQDADTVYDNTAPLEVDSYTVSLIRGSYQANTYKYYEAKSSALLAKNINAFSADSPFGLGVDGSISKSYCIFSPDFNPDLNLESKAFTLEWWDKINSFKDSVFPIISIGSTNLNAPVLAVRYYKQDATTVYLRFIYGPYTQSFTLPKNLVYSDWKHCALVRYDDYIHLYINNDFVSKIYIGQYVFSLPQNDGIIGAYYNTYTTPAPFNTIRPIDGNISNIRLVVDKALYPSSLPTQPLSLVTGTAMLYNGSYDNSFSSLNTAGAISLVKITAPVSFVSNPFGNSTEDCMLFHSGKHLRITDTGTTYDIGASNQPFTVECWLFALEGTAATWEANNQRQILSRGGGREVWGRSGYSYALYIESGALKWSATRNSSSSFTISFPNFSKNFTRRWVHVAVTYDGSITRLHVNGVEVSTFSASHTYTYTQRNKFIFKLGDTQAINGAFSNKRYFGYISNLRIIKGVNLYNASTFTPPTAALTETAETVLLLQSPYDNDVEFKFQPTIWSTTDDTLTFLDNFSFIKTAAPLAAMSGDFTVEFWFYSLREKHYGRFITETILDGRLSGTTVAPFIVRINDVSYGTISVYMQSATGTSFVAFTGGNIQPKTWYHFAAVRKNNIVNFYINGQIIGTHNDTSTWLGTPLVVGKQNPGGIITKNSNNNFFGYLTNVRITNGSAIYGSTYPVATSPLDKDSNTVFLLKAGVNLNKGIITTDAPSIRGKQQPPVLKRDAETYEALIEGSPWDDNTNDYLIFDNGRYIRFAPDTSFDLYQTPFTLEAWIRITNLNDSCVSANGLREYRIFSFSGFVVRVECDSIVSMSTRAGKFKTDVEIPSNEWVHVAIVCNPAADVEQTHLYIDGKKSWTWSGIAQMPSSPTIPTFVIGHHEVGGPVAFDPTAYFYIGYMSNIRLSRGIISRKVNDTTGNFTFNTLTTKIYNVIDSPNPTLDSAIFFDGSDGACLRSTSQSMVFAGEFTIEFYIKVDLTLVSPGETILHNLNTVIIKINPDGSITFGRKTTISFTYKEFTTPAAIETDTWTHVAITRDSGSNIDVYINGVIVYSELETASIGRSTYQSLDIGYPSTRFFLGGLKITNGSCLYSDPIIIPPYPLTADSNTILLLKGSFEESNYTPPYTDNFIPAGPLTAIPGTVLLLKAPYNFDDQSNQYTKSNILISSEKNPHTNSSAYYFCGLWNGTANAAHEGANFVTAYSPKLKNFTDELTISVWIKPDIAANQPHHYYFTRGNSWSFNRSSWLSWYNTFGRGRRCIISIPSLCSVFLTRENTIDVEVAFNSKRLSSVATVNDNEWSHIAITYKNNIVVLYINGTISHAWDMIEIKSTSTTNADIHLGVNSVRQNLGGLYWACSPGESNCYAFYHVDFPFFGLISDVTVSTEMEIDIEYIPATPFFEGLGEPWWGSATGGPAPGNIEPDTIFQYGKDLTYDVFQYQTSTGLVNFVNNTTIPISNNTWFPLPTSLSNITAGIPFSGDVKDFIRTQPLPAITGDVTIEMWFTPLNSDPKPNTQVLLDARSTAADLPWVVMLNRINTRFSLDICLGGNKFIIIKKLTNTQIFEPGKHYHLAIIRRNNKISVCLNGGLIGATAPSSALSATWPSGILTIGKSCNNKFPYKGVIYGIRIITRSDVYNTSFDPTLRQPPRSHPLTSGSYVFLSAEPLYAGSTIVDTAGNMQQNAMLLCAPGVATPGPRIALSNTLQSELIRLYNRYKKSPTLAPCPFSADIRCFDTNNLTFNKQIIAIPANAYTDLVNSEWAFEVSIFLNNPSNNTIQTILKKGAGLNRSFMISCNVDRTISLTIYGINPANNLNVVVFTGSSSTAIEVFKWTHIALTSDGTVVDLFIDGKWDATFNSAPVLNVPGPLLIGSNDFPTMPGIILSESFAGSMSNLRLVKGQRVYNPSIEVPTEELVDDTGSDNFKEVTLLLNGNGPDDSTNIVDSSSYNRQLLAQGNCKLQSIVSKFGGSAIRFSGVGDRIIGTGLPVSPGKIGPAIITTNSVQGCTFEFWIFATSAPQNGQVIFTLERILPTLTGELVPAKIELVYRANSISIITNYINHQLAPTTLITTNINWSLNTWHHIAVFHISKADVLTAPLPGSQVILWIDGRLIKRKRYTTYNGFSTSWALTTIGSDSTNSKPVIGFIDDFRATTDIRRIPRYPIDFSVPTTQPDCLIGTAVVLKAPYEQYTYYMYKADDIHIGGNIQGSNFESRTISLTSDITVTNMYIHKGGTLLLSNNNDATLNVTGDKGLQITSEGNLIIN